MNFHGDNVTFETYLKKERKILTIMLNQIVLKNLFLLKYLLLNLYLYSMFTLE